MPAVLFAALPVPALSAAPVLPLLFVFAAPVPLLPVLPVFVPVPELSVFVPVPLPELEPLLPLFVSEPDAIFFYVNVNTLSASLLFNVLVRL